MHGIQINDSQNYSIYKSWSLVTMFYIFGSILFYSTCTYSVLT